MQTVTVNAEPHAIDFNLSTTALLIIDMQRDFLQPGGFGESLGNDVSRLQVAIPSCNSLLNTARKNHMLVIHTREGHRADLSDVPPAKLARGSPSTRIGAMGPMGRILIRGEFGHDIISELAPLPGEPIIDKPGKGSFYATDLQLILQNHRIDTLIVCGVTTEVCVHTTVREANDRGFKCIVPRDACASYFLEFHEVALRMIKAQGGIFGWVTDAALLVAAINQH